MVLFRAMVGHGESCWLGARFLFLERPGGAVVSEWELRRLLRVVSAEGVLRGLSRTFRGAGVVKGHATVYRISMVYSSGVAAADFALLFARIRVRQFRGSSGDG